MIKYITSRPLWFNILVAIGVIVLLFVIFMLSLNWITRHGSSKTVPAVTGKKIDDAQKLLADKGFNIVLQDSVYYDSLPAGFVIKQFPEADQVVKVNRDVYVIINRFVAPDVSMPNLLGSTYRNAQFTLEKLGLHIGDTSSRVDFAKNSILEMSLNGNELKPGDKVKVGSRIDLVFARGLGNEDISVPKLVGLSLAEARIKLEAIGFDISLEPISQANIRDMESAYIWQQNPESRTPDGVPRRIRAGQAITVWLQVEPVHVDSVVREDQIPL